MTEIAEGYVLKLKLSPRTFEIMRKEKPIVHHMRNGENIRVRCISADKPHEEAYNVRPTLEDAYLWLMKKKN